MNRVIKFRAWDTDKKEMSSRYGFHLNIDGEIKHPSNVIIMQFTGLLDKNGKEIYEGDIVRTNWDSTSNINVIYWLKEASAFIQMLPAQWDEYRDNWIAKSNYGRTPNSGEAEIIGNIYEHPHLLQSTNP